MTPLQFYRALAATLPNAPRWCIASVLSTRGSTPRKRGAQLAVALDASGNLAWPLGSIGGGLAEARVLELAQQQLSDAGSHVAEITIDLAGAAQSGSPVIPSHASNYSGVCGGSMQILLSTIASENLRAQVDQVVQLLSSGDRAFLDVRAMRICSGIAPGTDVTSDTLPFDPQPLCVIGGGGHCGYALAQQLTRLGFPVLIVDDREVILGCDVGALPDVEAVAEWPAALAKVQQYQRSGSSKALVVLLSRNLEQDCLALRALACSQLELALIGMMGSSRRIRFVRESMGAHLQPLSSLLKAPIGIAIGAQTPDEIALSIAAELVMRCRDGKQS